MMGYWMNFCSNLECGVYVSSSFCFLGTHEVLSGVEKNILYKTWPLLMNIAPRICLAQSSCSSFIGIMNNLLSTIFHCKENTSKLTLHRSTLRKIGKRFCNRVGLVSEFRMGYFPANICLHWESGENVMAFCLRPLLRRVSQFVALSRLAHPKPNPHIN